ncbi:MAG TPA: hypothetical protein V6C91_21620 [Coleofasciculaceae cyanobacterium]
MRSGDRVVEEKILKEKTKLSRPAPPACLLAVVGKRSPNAIAFPY